MSYVAMNLKNRLISSNEEVIRFRFRTSRPNGLLLYSKGTQKDVLLLKLENNKLVLNLKLGPDEETNAVKAGSLLDNDLWHDVMISRRHHDLFFTVDRVLVKYRLKSDFPRLDLNNEVSAASAASAAAHALRSLINLIYFRTSSPQMVVRCSLVAYRCRWAAKWTWQTISPAASRT